MKKIISIMIIINILLALSISTFADTEKEYQVEYKECNIYRSSVEYIKNYEIKYEGYSVEKGYKDYNVELKLDEKLYPNDMDESVTLKELPEYQIKILNEKTGYVFVTKIDKLKNEGINKIKIEFKNLLKVDCVYTFVIKVKEINTEEIDNKKFDWKKVNPIIKFVNELKYGKFGLNKKIINVGEIKDCNKNVSSIGKTFYYQNGKPSELYFTKNTKIKLGENKLKTKNILYTPANKKIKPCWFKVEYVVNLTEKVEDSTEPSSSVEPSNSITPSPEDEEAVETNTNDESSDTSNDVDGMPKTGESDNTMFIIVALCCVIAAGISFIILKKKAIKNN